MNLYTRIGMYFFIIGALLSILDGVFLVSEQVRTIVYLLLIFTGVFAGILNVSEDEEHHFLVSSIAFLVVVMAFNQVLIGHPLLVLLRHFFQNAVTFVGSMALVVALKTIIEFGSQNYHVSRIESMELRTKDIEAWELSKPMHVWHFIVFLAVCFTFIIILLELPIYRLPVELKGLFHLLEVVIILIFVADLFVLYRQEGGWKPFFKNCWIDIVAAIPFYGVFGAFKLVRVARIARLGHTTKFFSEESGMNTYLRKVPRRTEDLQVVEHPHAKQKRTKKA